MSPGFLRLAGALQLLCGLPEPTLLLLQVSAQLSHLPPARLPLELPQRAVGLILRSFGFAQGGLVAIGHHRLGMALKDKGGH